MSERYVKPTPDTTWPDARDVGHVEWCLRYSDDWKQCPDRLFLAAVCSAYVALAANPDGMEMLRRLRAVHLQSLRAAPGREEE